MDDVLSRDRRAALRARCRELRNAATPAEVVLWDMLRGRRLEGLKFRRQHLLGPYILDFFCAERRLAVEADGAHHFTRPGLLEDANRTAFLRDRGIRVLRFSNQEILRDPHGVLAEIKRRVSSQAWPEEPPTAKLSIVIDRSSIAPSPFPANARRRQELRRG